MPFFMLCPGTDGLSKVAKRLKEAVLSPFEPRLSSLVKCVTLFTHPYSCPAHTQSRNAKRQSTVCSRYSTSQTGALGGHSEAQSDGEGDPSILTMTEADTVKLEVTLAVVCVMHLTL
eukprot:1153119-Pelagomonas_calceolata.AAC.21